MSKDSQQPPKAERFEDSPIAWFGEMFLAKDRGDFRRAARAQSELARLGWVVNYRHPRQVGKAVSK